jgi:hypothetical protein
MECFMANSEKAVSLDKLTEPGVICAAGGAGGATDVSAMWSHHRDFSEPVTKGRSPER